MGRSGKKGPIRPLRLALQHFPLISPPFSPIQPALTIYRTPYTHTRFHIQPSVMPGLYLFRLSSNDKRRERGKTLHKISLAQFHRMGRKKLRPQQKKRKVESEEAHFPLPSSRDPDPVIIILSFGTGKAKKKKKTMKKEKRRSTR